MIRGGENKNKFPKRRGCDIGCKTVEKPLSNAGKEGRLKARREKEKTLKESEKHISQKPQNQARERLQNDVVEERET